MDLEIIANNLLQYCILPTCQTRNIDPAELLREMMNLNPQNEEDKPVIKKGRGRPKGSKNKKPTMNLSIE